jgi:hypothetical protein
VKEHIDSLKGKMKIATRRMAPVSKRYPKVSRSVKKICKPKLPKMLSSANAAHIQSMVHFLPFFFSPFSPLVVGGSSAATIA